MKIECLVVNVTPVGSPDRAECDILGIILMFFGQFRPFLWWGSHFVMSDPLKEWNVMFLGMILHWCFWPIQVVLVVREPLCDVGTHAGAPITLLMVI